MYQLDVGAAATGRPDTYAALFPLVRYGAPEEIRTPNLLIRSQMLYPLSYGRLFCCRPARNSISAEAPGFEPGRGRNPQPH
jgi:hypothetical protein